jgi:UDP-N-acetyl-D-mannosaminuronic acid transferase (WecB/TagA/CpsF family)
MTTPSYVGDGNDDGEILGRSSGKIGFFGTSPVVQQSVTATITTTISQVATSGKWAFATSTAAKNLVTQVQDIKAALDALGLSVDG